MVASGSARSSISEAQTCSFASAVGRAARAAAA